MTKVEMLAVIKQMTTQERDYDSEEEYSERIA